LYPGEFDGEVFGLEDKAISDVLRSRGLPPTHMDLYSIFGIASPYEHSSEDQPPILEPLEVLSPPEMRCAKCTLI